MVEGFFKSGVGIDIRPLRERERGGRIFEEWEIGEK